MDITSTPFIRNDYWPDYNELNELNGRIDEVENELSLTNINLTDKIENVEGNLNAYISQQNNTVITNNAVVNNINANYATGDFLNFNNVNLDNVYVENLTVNKPVFDITLNTPHIDNITATGGNIFNTNLVNCNINIDSITLNNISIAERTITNELIINKNIEPIASSAVLGYDASGKVIPIRATYDVSFPEDADYIFTDHFGTAFAGHAEAEVLESNNLVTAYAVYNEALNLTSNIDNLRNDMNNEFNIVNNNFANIDNNFNDVANNFNDVANNFNDVNNSFNDVNNTANNLLDNVDYLKSALASLLNLPVANVSGWIDSTTPVNIQGITEFVVAPLVASAITGSDVGDGAKLNASGTTATLALPGLFWTKESMDKAFNNCTLLNQNIVLPSGVININSTFKNCTNLNQNILIPNSVTSMKQTFSNCSALNQNIFIPNSVTEMAGTFSGCTNLNQNIFIPNSVTSMEQTFFQCTSLNQNILIPNSVTTIYRIFGLCPNLNQNILIPNSVTYIYSIFDDCPSLNQNILIPNSVTNMGHAFENCTNLNQNILIPDSVTQMDWAFRNCPNLNQNMYIYSLQTGLNIFNAFNSCSRLTDKYIHIRSEIPKSTSNAIYNALVNGSTGVSWSGRVVNDLTAPTVWPPDA